MKPSRELDQFIAKEFMQWTVIGGKYWSKDGPTLHDMEAWSPSTDIAAAWEVLEKLRDLDSGAPAIWPPAIYAPGAVISLGEYNGSEWQVRMAVSANEDTPINWDVPGFVAYGETAPHAICLAALRAMKHV